MIVGAPIGVLLRHAFGTNHSHRRVMRDRHRLRALQPPRREFDAVFVRRLFAFGAHQLAESLALALSRHAVELHKREQFVDLPLELRRRRLEMRCVAALADERRLDCNLFVREGGRCHKLVAGSPRRSAKGQMRFNLKSNLFVFFRAQILHRALHFERRNLVALGALCSLLLRHHKVLAKRQWKERLFAP
jgi:hypothetical protein